MYVPLIGKVRTQVYQKVLKSNLLYGCALYLQKPEKPGPLVFQGGYHPGKTKHVIRVSFSGQRNRGAKSFKTRKKRCVIGDVRKFWKKGCVLKVLLQR